MSVIVKGKPSLDTELAQTEVLWRYLDVAKFLDMIRTQELHFTRGDQFEDKFEGSFTNSFNQSIEQAYKNNNIDFTCEEFKKRLRERVYLNCWYAGTDDSMAMWNLYGRSTTSLAVTTTVSHLYDVLKKANLPYELAIRKVRYVNHWQDPPLDTNPYSNVFSYKVTAYEYEKEVRVVIDRFHEDFDSKIMDRSMRVVVFLKNLLQSIVVAPEAPKWFFESITDVAQKYSVSAPIRRSMLSREPV